MTKIFLDDTLLHFKQHVQITHLTKNNVEKAHELVASSGMAVNTKDLEQYMLCYDGYKFSFLATLYEQPIGIILFTDCEDEVFLNHLYVSPEHRFKGIGSKLFNKVKEYSGLRPLSWIDTSNNHMPWMQALEMNKRIELANHLGSFYKK